MPKKTVHVEFNDSGEWKHAMVVGEESPENYNLWVFPNSGQPEFFGNVPRGAESGHWREPHA